MISDDQRRGKIPVTGRVAKTREEVRALRDQGAEVRARRQQANDERTAGGTKTTEEVWALREQAKETAACCADCFRPLKPTDSVTMVRRLVHMPAHYIGPLLVHERDRSLRVPICLRCSLITRPGFLSFNFRKESQAPKFCALNERPNHAIRRFRCEGCGRPMRVLKRDELVGLSPTQRYRAAIAYKGRFPVPERLTRKDRACCTDCEHTAAMRRDRERHRIRHEPIVCTVCGKMFDPKRSDATTCSNRCRQARFRRSNPPRAGL